MANDKTGLEKIREELVCAVCLDILREPKVLECAHSFCLPCLEAIATTQRSYKLDGSYGKDKLECPCCRGITLIPDGRAERLKTNFNLKRLAEIVSEEERKRTRDTMRRRGARRPTIDRGLPLFCNDHDKPLEYFCVECNELLCRRCMMERHKDHDYRDADAILPEQLAALRNLIQPAWEVASRAESTMEKLFSDRDAVAANCTATTQAIESLFDHMSKVLSQRKSALLSTVRNYSDFKLTKLDAHYQKLEKDRKCILQVVDRLEYVLQESEQNSSITVLTERKAVEEDISLHEQSILNILDEISRANPSSSFLVFKEDRRPEHALSELGNLNECRQSPSQPFLIARQVVVTEDEDPYLGVPCRYEDTSTESPAQYMRFDETISVVRPTAEHNRSQEDIYNHPRAFTGAPQHLEEDSIYSTPRPLTPNDDDSVYSVPRPLTPNAPEDDDSVYSVPRPLTPEPPKPLPHLPKPPPHLPKPPPHLLKPPPHLPTPLPHLPTPPPHLPTPPPHLPTPPPSSSGFSYINIKHDRVATRNYRTDNAAPPVPPKSPTVTQPGEDNMYDVPSLRSISESGGYVEMKRGELTAFAANTTAPTLPPRSPIPRPRTLPRNLPSMLRFGDGDDENSDEEYEPVDLPQITPRPLPRTKAPPLPPNHPSQKKPVPRQRNRIQSVSVTSANQSDQVLSPEDPITREMKRRSQTLPSRSSVPPAIDTDNATIIQPIKIIESEKMSKPSKTEVVYPCGVCCMSSDAILVTDVYSHCVRVIAASGKHLMDIGKEGRAGGEFKEPCGIAVGTDNHIFVTERDNPRVQCFTSFGKYLHKFGQKSLFSSQLADPWGVVVAGGKVYITDWDKNQIMVFHTNGKLVSVLGKEERTFRFPAGIAVNKQGQLLVVDRFSHCVWMLTAEGEPVDRLGQKGTAPGHLYFPYGVAVRQDGSIIVTESGNNRVSIFSSTGDFVYCFGRRGSLPGEFDHPRHVCVNSKGEIIIADEMNKRLQIFRL